MNPSFILPNRILKVLLLILTGLVLSGCTFTTVLNHTSQDVRVAILAPDSRGLRVVVLKPDDLKAIPTQIGGAYLVRVLADRTYIDQLTDIKMRLLLYANTPNLPVSEYNKTLADIETLRKQIKEAEEAASKDRPTCVGILVDYSTLDVTITFDASTQKVIISCNVSNFDNFLLSPPTE
jgi:hypothetical protein